MLRMIQLLLSFVLPAVLFGQANTQSQRKPLVFSHITVIDATGASAKPDMTVVITGDRITQLGPTGKVKVPKYAQVIDAKGKFLIPGLWDMHVHLDRVGEGALPLFIANGLTSVRDMGGGDFAQIRLWRESIARESLLGPRIKASGPILESTRFIQILEKIGGESLAGKRVGVGREAEVLKAVDSIRNLGVDFLKVRTNASREAYLAIAAEAKRSGLQLVGHAPSGVSLLEVSDAGQKSIEHGLVFLDNYTEAEWKELAARFIKNGTHSVPTLIAGRGFREMPDQEVMAIIDDGTNGRDSRRKYIPPALLEFWRQQMEMKKYETPTDWTLVRERNLQGFRILNQAGVRMMAGTDVAAPLVFPGFSLHEELGLLVKDIGMTRMEALQSATRNPAEFFGLGASLGTVEKGKIADLVLLDANPLEDISNTQKINAVVVRGKLIPKSELKRILATVEVAANRKLSRSVLRSRPDRDLSSVPRARIDFFNLPRIPLAPPSALRFACRSSLSVSLSRLPGLRPCSRLQSALRPQPNNTGSRGAECLWIQL